MTTPLGNWTSGLYPLLPMAPGAAELGGKPVALAQSAVGRSPHRPGTLMAVGSVDDERCTAMVPPALASFGV